MASTRVLVVEDEVKIAALLQDFLEADGFAVEQVHDGANVISAVKNYNPDCIILDVMLPNKDGFTLCKEIRSFSNTPIIFLTARVDEIDRLMGLGFGADDYVCKPFSGREVSARVQAILRRVSAAPTTEDAIQFDSILLYPERYECRVAEQAVDLTPVEFRLLLALVKRPGHVMSRELLMSHCYQDDRIVSHRTIDSHMKNVRQKLQQRLGEKVPVQAVYGVGYKVTTQ